MGRRRAARRPAERGASRGGAGANRGAGRGRMELQLPGMRLEVSGPATLEARLWESAAALAALEPGLAGRVPSGDGPILDIATMQGTAVVSTSRGSARLEPGQRALVRNGAAPSLVAAEAPSRIPNNNAAPASRRESVADPNKKTASLAGRVEAPADAGVVTVEIYDVVAAARAAADRARPARAGAADRRRRDGRVCDRRPRAGVWGRRARVVGPDGPGQRPYVRLAMRRRRASRKREWAEHPSMRAFSRRAECTQLCCASSPRAPCAASSATRRGRRLRMRGSESNRARKGVQSPARRARDDGR